MGPIILVTILYYFSDTDNLKIEYKHITIPNEGKGLKTGHRITCDARPSS